MKKLVLVALAMLMTFGAFARGWNKSNEISPDALPSVSRKIISKYFDGISSVTYAREWPSNYSAYLRSGQKLNFYTDGSLKEAKADGRPLPITILSELPGNVSSYIKTKYGNWELTKVEAKSSKIEVKLERGDLTAKLKFSGSGQLLKEKIDD